MQRNAAACIASIPHQSQQQSRINYAARKAFEIVHQRLRAIGGLGFVAAGDGFGHGVMGLRAFGDFTFVLIGIPEAAARTEGDERRSSDP